ncbi:MAG TPA: hypothetical protein VK152_06650 [Paludibacter sp.]|nr:hypothetical protein [Paludibacter sp.]
MPLFKCEKCGCIENTALGHYWSRNWTEFKGTEFEKALCSECTPIVYPNGELNKRATGKWHGQFPKELATEKDKGYLLNF